jgi:hypothetical protein
MEAVLKKIELSPQGIYYLNETRKWTMFISIVVFVMMGLAFFFMFFFQRIFSAFMPHDMYGGFDFSFMMIIPTIIFMVIYFFPFYYLLQFSRFSKLAVAEMEESLLEKSLKYLKMHYQFMGVLLIIGLVFYLIAILSIAISGNMMNNYLDMDALSMLF